ncbi:sulfatase [Planctomycetaceae bacterium SCGC AG-212-F19]|nr:sulfatase [Planctomycetaceae bacterium SCGC AG-212-F19]
MNSLTSLARVINRRTFLGRGCLGIGAMGLTHLLGKSVCQAASGEIKPHHPAKVKRVIYLYMAGGPSHLETFDYKPKLAEMHGQAMPESFTKGQPIAQLQGAKLNCFAPQHPFKKCGKSGQEIAEIFPHIGTIADEMCIIRSLHTEAINHDPAHTFMNTGTTISGRPSMGAWAWYGLGAECDNLPGFVVLTSTGRSGQSQPIAQRQWHSGFLPSRFQGVHFRSKGDAVLYVNSPAGVTSDRQKDIVEAAQALNKLQNNLVDDPEIATRISQYEMAFKMQTSVPELMDLAKESSKTLDLYGTKGADGSFAANCLLARRLAERGVRFIQLYHRDWDHHGNIKNDIPVVAKEVDQGCAALVKDLKQRGMLDDTLVIWGGEFGRTPMAQGNGRDHHIKGFSMWLAGGGIKGGLTYGATDDLGYNAEQDRVSVHDLHATILHLMGVDHEKLTFFYQGRQFRLTDVSGEVVKAVLA